MTPVQQAASTQPQTRSGECLNCSRAFGPTRDWSRFCSDSCRAEHWRLKKQNPPSVAAEAAGDTGQQANAKDNAPRSPIRKGSKLFNVLAAFACGTSLNRFEAYRSLHDAVLPSTVSQIERRGIVVSRREEVVLGFGGSRVRCCRYWLEPNEREKAFGTLGCAEARQ